MNNFNRARKEEMDYHEKFYRENELFQPGTWISKPVKIAMDSFDLLELDNINALDLGCGVGRNCIPLAQRLEGRHGMIYCVDLLHSAIDILNLNAKKYRVEDRIVPIVADAEYYEIQDNFFDYILACSCLEHVSAVESFHKVIKRMQLGTRNHGINCILMSTEVSEKDLESGVEREGLIELNMSTDSTFEILRREYTEWDILIERFIPQEIEEHKNGNRISFRGNC